MKNVLVAPVLFAFLTSVAAAAEPLDPVMFGTDQPIPATLTLNYSDTGKDARKNPIYNNYRPKVRFGGRDVVCMVHLPKSLRQIAPGESGEVSLKCKESVSVQRAAGTFDVIEGTKPVGSVQVKLPHTSD